MVSVNLSFAFSTIIGLSLAFPGMAQEPGHGKGTILVLPVSEGGGISIERLILSLEYGTGFQVMAYDDALGIRKKIHPADLSPAALFEPYGIAKILEIDSPSDPKKFRARFIEKKSPSQASDTYSLPDLYRVLGIAEHGVRTEIERFFTSDARAASDYESGLRQQAENRFQDAAVFYKNALQRDPNFAMASIRLAQCRYMTGDLTDVLGLTEKLIGLLIPSPALAVYKIRYKALILKGERESARRELGQAIELADSAEMSENKAELYLLAASSYPYNDLTAIQAWDLALSAAKIFAETGNRVGQRQSMFTAAYVAVAVDLPEIAKTANAWLDKVSEEIDPSLFPEQRAVMHLFQATVRGPASLWKEEERTKNFELAEALFRRGGSALGVVETRLKRASFLLGRGADTEAETLVLELQKENGPSDFFHANIEAEILRAQIELGRGKLESAALRLWSLSEELGRKSWIVLKAKVDDLLFPCLFQLGWLGLAQDLSEKAVGGLHRDRSAVKTLGRHGDILFLRERPHEAIWYYEAASEALAPSASPEEVAGAIRQLAHARIWTGSLTEGERLLETARRWSPGHKDNDFLLAHLQFRKGHVGRARALLANIKHAYACRWSEGHEFLLKSWTETARDGKWRPLRVWLPHYL